MKLLYSELSPFARKVRMVAHHHQLQNRVELVITATAERGDALMRANPLGKIPALVLENGHSIIDSPVIAAYLDAIGSAEKLLPADALARVHIMHLEALADGILDAAVLCVMETRRPEDKRWQGQFDKQLDNIRRAIQYLEQQVDFFTLPFSMAHLSAGAALEYLHGRLAGLGFNEDWLASTPQLAAWYTHFLHHPLMLATAPKEGWG